MKPNFYFTLILVFSLFASRVSAQTPEQIEKWQTPEAIELAKGMQVVNNQIVDYPVFYSQFEEYAKEALQSDPSNALLYYFLGVMNSHRMYMAPLTVGFLDPVQGTSVEDSSLTPQQQNSYKRLYALQEESSRQAQEHLLKAAELGFAGSYVQLADLLRGAHAVVGSLKKEGFTRWEERTDQKVVDFLQLGVNGGSNEAKEQLASLYLRGEGEIKQDIKKGEEIAQTVKDPAGFYFRLASGFLSAKTKRDSATEFDYSLERGKEYMLKAAAMNQPDALYELALSYLRFPEAAPLTPEDHKLGYATMVKVATSAKEAPQAYFYLSQLLRQGKGTEKNLPKAIEMVEELAGQSSDAEEKEFLQKELSKMKAEL